jgi:hypothetical protein
MGKCSVLYSTTSITFDSLLRLNCFAGLFLTIQNRLDVNIYVKIVIPTDEGLARAMSGIM